MKYFLGNFFNVLKTFKASSIINIVGLSVALVVFFIVLMQVDYDFTYDRGYRNADKIVQFNIYDGNTGGAQININFQTPALIGERTPETGTYCMLSSWGEEVFDLDKGDVTPETHKVPVMRTTSGFWNVFTPEIISGDTTGIFSSPGQALISEKTAQRLFGEDNPVGKSIKYHYEGNELTVQAVYRDFPENSSLNNGLYTYLREYEESEWSFYSYFLVNPENLALVNEKINTKDILGEESVKYLEEHPEINIRYRLSSLNDLYLTNAGKGGSKRINTTLSLLAVGILTLAIAFVNFVNLSLAMAPSRVRSINIRKILGINKSTLRLAVAGESVLFTLTALIIAFTGIYFLKGSTLAEEMFDVDFSLQAHTGLLTVTSLLILLLAFAIGLYTMRYSTSFDESEALKGSFALGIKGVKLRNVLIVLQFTTAIVLICISTLIKRQNDYMMNYDWGMPKENIIYLPLAGLGQSTQSFGQELLRDPRISDYCITRALPGKVGMSWGRDFEGKHINLVVWSVDDRFFDFFDVDIIAGRKPEHMDSLVSQIVVNEAFLREYEFDESIVGKDFPAFGPGRLQAIAKDVNFQSLHEPITPMAFGVLSQWQQFNFLLVKLTGNDMRGAISRIEQTWNNFSKEPFEMNFLDEEMDRLYQKETNMAKLIGLFGFIIVIIAVMGVYGLIVFNARYKAKEIAIRKVNGSSIGEVMLMLNRNVLIQLGIAFVVAVPIAYYIMHKWLENFAYKTTIHWWIFLLGGLVILLITLITVSAQSFKAATKNPTVTLNSNQ
jgi:putative ABC transport system permease protein